MPSTQTNNALQKEGRLLLALQAIQKGQFKSIRAAALAYKVSKTTLRARIKGRPSQDAFISPNCKLKPSEEDALVIWILQMSQRGYPPFLIDVRRMANTLLAERDKDRPVQIVGENWTCRFVQRHPELDSRLSRRLDVQRAKCEDPKVIGEWFERVKEIRLQYGILDDDVYNFDETGFAIGVIVVASKVVTNTKLVRYITII